MTADGTAATGQATLPPNPVAWRVVTFAGAALVVLAAVLIPANATATTVTDITQVAALAVAFAGLSLLTHHVGLLSLGQGAFVGVGAFAALHSVNDLGLPLLAMPVVGLAAGFAVGAVLAVPALRLPKPYLALLTLSAAVAFPIVLRQLDGPLPVLLDGEFLPPAALNIDPRDEHLWEFMLVVAWAVVALWFLNRLLGSPVGRALAATRDDPVAAAAFGVPVYRLRLLAVALSGALGGLAGALTVVPVNFTQDALYPEELSIKMFALTIAATAFAHAPVRLARPLGYVAAAAVLVLLPVWLDDQVGWAQARGLGGLLRSEGFFYAVLLVVGAFLTSTTARQALAARWRKLRGAD